MKDKIVKVLIGAFIFAVCAPIVGLLVLCGWKLFLRELLS